MVCCDHQDHLDFANNGNETWSHSHLVYSDDGESWKVGGVADRLTNECAVAEVWRPPFAFLLFGSKTAGTRFAQLWNGTIVVNSRDYLGQKVTRRTAPFRGATQAARPCPTSSARRRCRTLSSKDP